MQTRGELRMEPGALETASRAEIELVIPFTLPAVTRAVVERAAALTHGLNARILLVAVHAAPHPAAYGFPTSTHAFLVERLLELSEACPLPVSAQVVLAPSRQEGLEFALHPGSTVLLGSRRRFWRTAEERLGRALAAAGHNVALVYIE
jgi:hypothetical protein